MFNLKPIPSQQNLKYFFWFLILKLIIGAITSGIAYLIDPSSLQNPADDYGILFTTFLLLIFAPIIETLIYQFLVIEILRKIKIPPGLIISFSAILFGLSHHYHVFYIIATTISGIIYALYYLKLRPQGKLNAILGVTGLHFLSNLVALLSDL
ncbi:type II CAAX prenyl endopeptidase Rce1 family protein [Sphingobacterium sp.]|uniref:CPBP family glutamic-type intramembrane protease n=1 Tax=Sphingobacterium sp. TaxID=341027 RepID=UPI0028A86A43|nr:CPBP family glutamic-type intramembrane protease [Sphingobacterium sp.]